MWFKLYLVKNKEGRLETLWEFLSKKGAKAQKSSTIKYHNRPEVITLLSYLTRLSTKFILLINVKMPTIVDILTFISMINTTPERLKARNIFICRYFSLHKQLKFHAKLRWAWKKFYNLGAWPRIPNQKVTKNTIKHHKQEPGQEAFFLEFWNLLGNVFKKTKLT